MLVQVRGGPDELTVRVQNQGVIPPALLPTIFDPFRSGHTTTKSRGLGLGLFISQQIAVAHGGTIDVESNESTGTVFTVRLPRAARASRPLGPDGAPRKVLIVDDDQHTRESLKEAFEEEAYEVATAANGREALDLLTTGALRPDVVILDLVMPVIDGARVYQALQADAATARIPVIVSTSSPGRAPAGVVVVPKPLKLDRLLDAVAALWNQEGVQGSRGPGV